MVRILAAEVNHKAPFQGGAFACARREMAIASEFIFWREGRDSRRELTCAFLCRVSWLCTRPGAPDSATLPTLSALDHRHDDRNPA